MCEPTTLLALSIASTVASAAATNSAARNQGKAINSAAHVQQAQINAKSSQEQFERSREGNRERGSIRVSAGESGVAGGSVRNQLMDSLFQEGMDASVVESNRKGSIEASHAETRSRIASLKTVSPLEVGLSIGTDVAMSKFGKDLFRTPKKIP